MTEKQFKSIYDTHVSRIRNYLYYRSGDPHITDDLTQETFLRVWEKQSVFHSMKIKSLLYKIANQLFLDWVRKHRLQTDHLEQIQFQWQNDIIKPPEAEAIREKCEKILVVLTEKERTVFLLHKRDELSQTDIAQQLDVSIKTVERWMRSAKQKIKSKKNEKSLQRNSVL